MSNNKVSVTIKGISPLLMHRFPMIPVEGIDKLSAEQQAEHSAYRDDNKNLFVPGLNLQRALVSAATYSKGKGRASLQKQVAACVFVTPERIALGTKDYVVDSRPVVIAATKGRIVRHRPRLDSWQLSFQVEYDPTLLKETELRRIVDDAGTRVGLLDFRPERKGPFGRFMVTDWKNGK